MFIETSGEALLYLLADFLFGNFAILWESNLLVEFLEIPRRTLR